MDLIDLKKRTDKAIADPAVRTEAGRYPLRTRLAFLPDDVIGHSWFFRLLTLVYYYWFVLFHGFERTSETEHHVERGADLSCLVVVGAENLDANQACLMIARHSTHNGEILGTIVCMYHFTGRVIRYVGLVWRAKHSVSFQVVRSLIHRCLTPFFPILRLMGAVPGEPKSALSLLKCGFWVVVVPGSVLFSLHTFDCSINALFRLGGADEGMVGHENAYKVCWPEKRTLSVRHR